MPSPQLRHVADLKARIGTLHPGAVCIGPEGTLWMIAYDRPLAETPEAELDLPIPHELTVLNFREGVLNLAVTVHNPGGRSFVQPLGGNELILVGARTGGKPNARVVASKGGTVREFLLGDGISDVQTTRAGEIWVSYYDDGTAFGCWKLSGRSGPLAAMGDGSNNEHYGLLRASDTGEVSWRFIATSSIAPIYWCDGLNVLGDSSAVWTSYSPFPGGSDWDEPETSPIVRISPDGSMRGWRLKGAGWRGLAVHGDRIALGGGWGDDYGSFAIGRLGDGDMVEDLRDLGIHDETPAESRIIGRGPVLNWIQGTRWSVLDLSD